MAPSKKTDQKAVLTQNVIVLPPLNFARERFDITGTAPLVIHKFSSKTITEMAARMMLGDAAKTQKARPPRDFEADYQGAFHVSREGWHGIAASSFRHALISDCRTVGLVMTRTKLAFWIEQDGFDRDDGQPLVRIHGTPRKYMGYVRNSNGEPDIRARPMWDDWYASVVVGYDPGMLTGEALANLMQRAGRQVGVAEGRPDSKNSPGMGWGTFALLTSADKKGAKRSAG